MKTYLYLILALLCCATATAQTDFNIFEVDGYKYKLLEDEETGTIEGAAIVKYLRYDEEHVNIPASVTFMGKAYPVISISSLAFYNDKIVSVNIPEPISDLNNEAFYYCTNLTDITFPSSIEYVSIDAFDGTAWYENQPDGVIYIGNIAYKYKGDMPKGTSIRLRDGTTSIGPGAFWDCENLKAITLPASLTEINENAFTNCTSLKSIRIPRSVNYISDNSFWGCLSLEAIEVEPGNEVYDSRDNCNGIIFTDENLLFVACANTIVPKGVKKAPEADLYKKADIFTEGKVTELNIVEDDDYYGKDKEIINQDERICQDERMEDYSATDNLETDDPEKIFVAVEQMPEFPGGNRALAEFLSNNLQYPEAAAQRNVTGKVYVKFLVTATGKVDKVQIARTADKDLDEEALRVCRLLPDFIPGRQDGQPINVWYTLPITFGLSEVTTEESNQ